MVTNPDVGLTATVTPRGSAVSLAIDSLSATEMVVRAPAGTGDVSFDYTVFGLRLGFEAMPIVQPRVDDAPLPPMAAAPLDAAKPKPDTAFARFVAMRGDTKDTTPLDLSRGLALKAAIGIGKEGPPADRKHKSPPPHGTPPSGQAESPGGPAGRTGPGPVSGAAPAAAPPTGHPSAAVSGTSAVPAIGPDRFPAGAAPIAVEGEVHGGDIIAVRPGGGAGLATPATQGAGEVAVGIVAGDPETAWTGVAPLALGGSIVRCRVDASLGAIAVGDLLTLSDVPGQARRAAAGDGGPIVAKALEPLAEGRGLVRVLAVAR